MMPPGTETQVLWDTIDLVGSRREALERLPGVGEL